MGRDRWEHFEHGADVGVRGIAASLSGAFEQAALALTAVVVDPSSVAERRRIEVECEAPDLELLLVDWLNTIIYEMATRGMVFGRYAVEITQGQLHGRAWGEDIDPARHDVVVEVKGATLTALRVAKRGDRLWTAECIVDV